MLNTEDLIGIPFKRGGRDKNGLDCYGLVKLIYAQNGITLPEYISPESNKETEELISNEKNNWDIIWSKYDMIPFDLSLPKEGDVLLISIKGLSCHVGYVYKSNWFLHTWEDTNGVVAERVSLWKTRIVGIYRYNG